MLNASFTSSHLIHSTTLCDGYYYSCITGEKTVAKVLRTSSISILLSFSRENNSLGRDAYITPNNQPWHYMTISIVFTWKKEKQNKTNITLEKEVYRTSI